MKEWKKIILKESTTILEAIKVIDTSQSQIALIVDDEEKLIGTVTDGDIRRGILRGVELSSSVGVIMGRNCHTAPSSMPREEVYKKIVDLNIRHMPIVSQNNTVVGLSTIDDFISRPKMNTPVVIMAGGLGTRLRPLTNDTPKPMLKIGPRPILETIIQTLAKSGFNDFIIAVNYKAEVIKDYFSDGKKFGVSIRYLEEKESKGTAGALTLLNEPYDSHYLVVNGDVLTQINFQAMVEFHFALQSSLTMCVRDYDVQIPYGVVEVDNFSVTSLVEKPRKRFFVNGGMYILSAECIRKIPKEGKYDMTQLIDVLIKEQKTVSSFPVHEYWLDVGKHDDFNKATLEYEKIFVPNKQSKQEQHQEDVGIGIQKIPVIDPALILTK